jgi:Ca2+-binding RTX toxin-like protein
MRAAMRPTLRRRAAIVAVGIAVCGGALLPAGASGSTAYIDGSTVIYAADPGETNDLAVTLASGLYTLADSGATIVAQAPCAAAVGGHNATCPATGITAIFAFTDDGNDHAVMSAATKAVFCGGAGNDRLEGGGGDDFLIGGAGNDNLTGGAGTDVLDAEDVDTCPGSGPTGVSDQLDGGAGSDFLYGGPGNDTMVGGPGDDSLFGRTGADTLDGGDGNDALVGLDGADVLDAGAGNDILAGGEGNDILRGGDGADELGVTVRFNDPDINQVVQVTENGDDTLEGDAGDDTLDGGPGAKSWNYGVPNPAPLPPTAAANGADRLSGGDGSDQVTYVNRTSSVDVTLDGLANDGGAGEGDNVSPDVERVTGGSGSDRLTGGPGDDALDGGPGADVLAGGAGADTLVGGADDEVRDELDGGPGDDALNGGPGNDLLRGGDGADGLDGDGGDDTMDGGPGDDQLRGGTANDTLTGGPGADTLDGGPDRDVADYSAETAAVTVTLDGVRNDGETGHDLVVGVEDVAGGSGADTLVGDAGPNLLSGGAGEDFLEGGGGPDDLRGGTDADALVARDGTPDKLACGSGSDLAVADRADSVPRGASSPERCELGAGVRPRLRTLMTVRPRACAVPVRLPAAHRFFPLRDRVALPLASILDSRSCAIDLTVATDKRGHEARARISGGEIRVRQARSIAPATELSLAGCGRGSVRIRVGGPFRMRGRYSTASARRASWTTQNSCTATVTRVQSGTVVVDDRARRRHARLEAGEHYTARPRRRAGA